MSDMRGLHILVVEDNDFNSVFIASLLKSAGCDVAEARNGEDAIAAFGNPSEYFSGVVMDINLPGIDGVATTRVLRERFPSMPIVALTSGSQATERECYEAGFDRYIQKPVTKKHLVDTLISAIDQREQERGYELPFSWLVVSKDGGTHLLVAELLGEIHANVSIMTAMSGAQAVELASTICFDVVIVDTFLPDMHGAAAAREIQSSGGHVPKFIVGFKSGLAEIGCGKSYEFGAVPETPLRAADLVQFFRKENGSSKCVGKCSVDRVGVIAMPNETMCKMFG
jgi:CheY-like chemotaxis protein